jgi:6-pyruvoyltetrahydropterin/6-carboxytetrahydropterin synthase
MVINLEDLKHILDEEIVKPLDFKNLNRQIDFFKDRLTTLENLSVYIWQRLQPRLDSISLELTGLKTIENDDLFVEYYGGAELKR